MALMEKSPGSSSLWTKEFLQDSRKRRDPLADAFVAELVKTKTEKELFIVMQVLLNEFVWIEDIRLDETATKYLNTASRLPEWADKALIKKGEEFFALHGFEISMVLNMKALPATYCCWRGAEVVYASGRMTDHSGNLKPFTRRLMQTSKFVLNVLTPGGMSGDGIGIRSSVKVRTLHAFIRYYLECKNWDVAQFGQPINQEDYAGTMLSFSVFVIEGMERLGIKVSDEEKEAYFHVWRVVAHVVGVEEALIATNYAEGALLGHTILDEQKGPSEAGKALTGACLTFLQDLIPFRVLKFLPNEMMYYLLGKELSDMAGIRRSRNPVVIIVFFLFRQMLKVFEWLKENVGFVRRWAIRKTPSLLNTIIVKFLDETGNPFTPEILHEEVETMKEHKH